MNEKIINQENIKLRNDLYRLKSNLNNSLEEYDKLFSLVKSGVMVDGEIIYYNIFIDIKNKLNSVNNSLVNDIIPRVNDSI